MKWLESWLPLRVSWSWRFGGADKSKDKCRACFKERRNHPEHHKFKENKRGEQ